MTINLKHRSKFDHQTHLLGARSHESACKNCKYFELIRVYDATLKKADADSRYNWRNIQYVVDVGEKSNFELIFSPFKYIKLPFSQLNALSDKKQLNVRVTVNFLYFVI